MAEEKDQTFICDQCEEWHKFRESFYEWFTKWTGEGDPDFQDRLALLTIMVDKPFEMFAFAGFLAGWKTANGQDNNDFTFRDSLGEVAGNYKRIRQLFGNDIYSRETDDEFMQGYLRRVRDRKHAEMGIKGRE